jgi:uncharacterized membrane protein
MRPSYRTLLIISVTVNVFLLGGIGGALYQWLQIKQAVVLARHHNIRFAAETLTLDDQKTFSDLLKQHHHDVVPLVKEAHAGRQEVAKLLVAPQFDQQAIDDALTKTRTAEFEQRRQLEEGIVTFASSLPLDERLRFADGLRRRGSFQLPARPASQASTEPSPH